MASHPPQAVHAPPRRHAQVVFRNEGHATLLRTQADLCPNRATFGRHRSSLDDSGSKLAESAKHCPEATELSPESTKSAPNLVRIWIKVARVRPDSARNRPKLPPAKAGPPANAADADACAAAAADPPRGEKLAAMSVDVPPAPQVPGANEAIDPPRRGEVWRTAATSTSSLVGSNVLAGMPGLDGASGPCKRGYTGVGRQELCASAHACDAADADACADGLFRGGPAADASSPHLLPAEESPPNDAGESEPSMRPGRRGTSRMKSVVTRYVHRL